MSKVKEIRLRFKPVEEMLVTKEVAAALLKVSTNTFYDRFVKPGLLPVVILDEVQQAPLYYYDDIKQLINSRRKYVTQDESEN
jgi:hypothetical protein